MTKKKPQKEEKEQIIERKIRYLKRLCHVIRNQKELIMKRKQRIENILLHSEDFFINIIALQISNMINEKIYRQNKIRQNKMTK